MEDKNNSDLTDNDDETTEKKSEKKNDDDDDDDEAPAVTRQTVTTLQQSLSCFNHVRSMRTPKKLWVDVRVLRCCSLAAVCLVFFFLGLTSYAILLFSSQGITTLDFECFGWWNDQSPLFVFPPSVFKSNSGADRMSFINLIPQVSEWPSYEYVSFSSSSSFPEIFLSYCCHSRF
jgi:hypothetical protein